MYVHCVQRQSIMGSGLSASTTTTTTNSPPPTLTIMDGHCSILERAGNQLLSRSAVESKVLDLLQTHQTTVIFAASGQGKSTFVAQLVSKVTTFDVVHSVFIGSVAGSTNLYRVLVELCSVLLDDLKNFHLIDIELFPFKTNLPQDEMGLAGLLAKILLHLANSGKTVLICLDALNELEGTVARTLTFLPHQTSSSIKFLLTTIYKGEKIREKIGD